MTGCSKSRVTGESRNGDAEHEGREHIHLDHVAAVTKAPNVKHQRARATVSRVKDELSVRALRCMR